MDFRKKAVGRASCPPAGGTPAPLTKGVELTTSRSHHPRLAAFSLPDSKTWLPATSAGMTNLYISTVMAAPGLHAQPATRR
jgi:hypothetical protein